MTLSKRGGKQGKGAGTEECPEHWIILLLLDPPHKGTPKRKMRPSFLLSGCVLFLRSGREPQQVNSEQICLTSECPV